MTNTTKVPGATWDEQKETWTIRVSSMVNGKRKEAVRTLTHLSKSQIKEVQAEADALKAEVVRRLEGSIRRPFPQTAGTLMAFVPEWLNYLRESGRAREYVIESKLLALETFVLPHLGNRSLHQVRGSDILDWMTKIGTMRTKEDKLYAKDSLITAWSALKGLLRYALVKSEIRTDPTQGVRFFVRDEVKGAHRPKKKVKATLSVDELERFIRATNNESKDIQAMLVLGFSTSLRFCELSGLWWSDIDLDKGRLLIQRSQVGGVLGPPKTEATRREVYLDSSVVAVLRAHREWQKGQGFVWMKDPDMVFPSRQGTYRFPSILIKPMARCCRAAGIDKHLSSHCQRKTANNLLRQNSTGIVTRAMVGHTDEAMTFLYSNVGMDERAQAHQAAFKGVFSEAVVGGPTLFVGPPAGVGRTAEGFRPEDGAAEGLKQAVGLPTAGVGTPPVPHATGPKTVLRRPQAVGVGPKSCGTPGVPQRRSSVSG